MKSNKNELILLIILILGLFLRIYDLGNESIWLDEASSIADANSNLFKIVKNTAGDNHTPLYAVVLHFWINLFGDSEISTRFLSVLFGFFAIFMIYKVGSLIFDKEVGILGALLVAVSTLHINYSQEVRMYSLMALLTLLSMYFFIQFLNKRSLIISIGYILSSILLIYSHYYGFFIIIAQNIYILTLFLFSKKVHKLNFRIWLLLQLVLILLFTPWVLIFIKQALRVKSGQSLGWIPVPSMHSLIESLKLYSGSNILLCLFLILSSYSLVSYKKIREGIDRKVFFKSIEGNKLNIPLSNAEGIYLLLVWLLTPIILPFMISKLSTPIYWYKYTIGASLAFYLLVAVGIRNIDYKYIKLAVTSLVIIVSLASVWRYYSVINKERWIEAANYIDMNAGHGDLLLFNAGYCQRPFDYYSKRTDLIKKSFPQKTRDVDDENIRELTPIVEGYDRVWVILAHSGDSKELITKTLNQPYNLSNHKKYFSIGYDNDKKHPSIELYLFERKRTDIHLYIMTSPNILLSRGNALITGAERTIGKIIAIETAKQGANILFPNIDEEGCKKLEQEFKMVIQLYL